MKSVSSDFHSTRIGTSKFTSVPFSGYQMWLHSDRDGGPLVDRSLADSSYLPFAHFHAAHAGRVNSQGSEQQLRHGKGFTNLKDTYDTFRVT